MQSNWTNPTEKNSAQVYPLNNFQLSAFSLSRQNLNSSASNSSTTTTTTTSSSLSSSLSPPPLDHLSKDIKRERTDIDYESSQKHETQKVPLNMSGNITDLARAIVSSNQMTKHRSFSEEDNNANHYEEYDEDEFYSDESGSERMQRSFNSSKTNQELKRISNQRRNDDHEEEEEDQDTKPFNETSVKSIPSAALYNSQSNGHIKPTGLICVVCGAPANGYNFDRITCESCKAFFRRNAFRPLVRRSFL